MAQQIITQEGALQYTNRTQINANFTELYGSSGTFTLNGTTPVTVTNANLTANSVVIFGLKTVGGTVSPNGPAQLTVTPGTGFTVGGTAGDTSVYNYRIIG